ncbi:glucose-1-phosphate adenylyltransferase subunit GlgD [Anaerovorax odorimutans]|uniref:glucose-1-phosphate adenylyltransferase subunit GlgD n=1 Tax=Anaerovorax odorimutans TaxID=109327 RepID=UPI000406F238|nr:glucose-1-phosphate adenylyltransferase subunit GlgD [Anaerovorax odorimutans]
MMSNVLGLIFSYSERENLREMTKTRTLASLPFGGKYRIIDFILSNYVNSAIYDIFILTRNNYHSLVDHLGSGKEWDLTRKRGGLRILSPFSNPGSNETGVYKGTIEALSRNMHSIRRSMAEYIVISGSSILCQMNFQDILKSHIERNADITVAYTRAMNGCNIIPQGVNLLKMDEDERIHDLIINNDDINAQDVTCDIGVIVLKKSLLESLVADAMSYGRYDFYRDIIQRLSSTLNILGYECKNHIFEISSVTGYMQANMNLLNEDVRKNAFVQPIYTKVKDSVPAIYLEGCHVKNSIISDGCKIEGSVENSILSRGVKIGKGAIVKNSIIMQNAEIMKTVILDHVILDKDVMVRENRHITGHDTYPVVIEKFSIV